MSMKEAITAYSIGFLEWFGCEWVGCGCVIRVCNAVKNQSDEFGNPEVGPNACHVVRSTTITQHEHIHVSCYSLVIIDWAETGTGE